MKYIYQIVFICTVLSTFIVSIFQYRYGTVQYHYPIFKKNKKIHYGTVLLFEKMFKYAVLMIITGIKNIILCQLRTYHNEDIEKYILNDPDCYCQSYDKKYQVVLYDSWFASITTNVKVYKRQCRHFIGIW